MDTMEKFGTFIDTVNKAMPGAWEAAVKQTYIYGALCAVITVITGIVTFTCMSYLSKDRPKEAEIVSIIGISAALIAVTCLIFTVLLFANPKYWAMQLLLPS